MSNVRTVPDRQPIRPAFEGTHSSRVEYAATGHKTSTYNISNSLVEQSVCYHFNYSAGKKRVAVIERIVYLFYKLAGVYGDKKLYFEEYLQLDAWMFTKAFVFTGS
jgi:hypothetical protein